MANNTFTDNVVHKMYNSMSDRDKLKCIGIVSSVYEHQFSRGLTDNDIFYKYFYSLTPENQDLIIDIISKYVPDQEDTVSQILVFH